MMHINIAHKVAMLGVALATVYAQAATLEVGVGKAYTNIQSAINAAKAGDTVLVYDGVYEITEQIDIATNIVVRSANGKGKTEIRRVNVQTDAKADTERCVRLAHAEAVLDGFTISGGRIYNSEGSESADWIGAGVLIDAAGGTLANSSVTNCTMGRSKVYGAGLGMLGTLGVVTNCVISGNRNGFKSSTSTDGWNTYGAGVYMAGGLIVDSVIARNYDAAQNAHYGAGLYVKGGTIRRTRITENVIHRAEGGDWSNQGAGACVDGAATFEDCLFARNRTNRGNGGGVRCNSAATFTRCTFADNEALSGAGGSFENSSCRLYDCVFGGNVTYSDISVGAPDWRGNANAIYSNCLSSVALTSKSIDCVVGTAYFMDGDYTLSPASALQGVGWKCPKAGVADFVRTGDTCIAGEDIVFTYGVQGTPASRATFTAKYDSPGTYSVSHGDVTKSVHVSAKELYVPAGGDIQSVIDSAEDGATVHVAADMYTLPSQLVVEKGIALVGDEGATATTLRRNVSRPTYMNAFPVGACITNRCLLINHPKASACGFTLTGGWCFADDISYNLAWSGSGALVGPRGGFLSDCTVTDCGQARMFRGGALSVIGRNSVASNVTVSANISRGWKACGAGVWISGGGTVTHATIFNNDNNTGCENCGAGVYALAGRLSHSRVTGNTVANQEGGGAGVYSYSSDFVCDNCLISGNTSTGRPGGGIRASGGTFVNCTIVGNSASAGGGVYGNSASLKFHNCIIQGNAVTADATAGAPEWNGANTKYTYCVSTKALPTADSSNRVGTVTMEAGSDYVIAAGSLAYDAGSTETFAEYAGTTDLDGNARVWGDAIDMGCYEYFSTERYSASVKVPEGVIMQDKAATFTASIVNPRKLPLVCVWTVAGSSAAPYTNETFVVTLNEPGYQTVNMRIYDGDEAKDFPTTIYVTPHDIYVVSPDTPDHVPTFPYATEDDAATNLLEAVAAANDGSTIHVAAGIHPVTNEVAVAKAITLVGTEGAARTIVQRAEKNNTIFSPNKHRVLSINHADAVVRGLSFANGFLNDQNVRGAGVYIGALGGTLADSIVSNNAMYANMYTYGGGVYMAAGTITNSIICFNTNMTQNTDGGAYGGGICVKTGKVLESRIERNMFYYSMGTKPTQAVSSGGGAFVEYEAVFRNCLFANNVSEGATGGLSVRSYKSVRVSVTNCTFFGNTAVTRDALFKDGTTVATAAGVDFVASVSYAGAIDLVNTAFSANVAAGTETANIGTSDLISKTAVEEVDATAFRNPAKGNWRPSASSVLVDGGVYADWMAGAPDLRGKPRATKSMTVDIGAYQANHVGTILLVR